MAKSKSSSLDIQKFFKNHDVWAYFGYFGIVIILASTFKPIGEMDTQALLYGVDYALGCISAIPMLLPCGPAVVHFPIFQYLIAAPLNLAGLEDASILKIFSFMNLGWFIISCAVFWQAGFLSSGRPGGHLGLLVLLSGYLLWYMSSSFNESASFALFSLLALSIISRWRQPYVCILAFACTITKEVVFPFVFYFMFLSFLARESRAAPHSPILYRVFSFFSLYKFSIASILVGIALNLLFNYFRFGSINNLQNLNPALMTPWSHVPIFFAYLFISPSGGLFFTWFSLCFMLFVPLLMPKRDCSITWIVVLIALGVVMLNLGLARWFSPFGWTAWGPRLTLPVLGAVGVLAVYLVTPQVINLFSRKWKKNGLIILVCIVVASSLPNLSMRLDSWAFFGKMIATTKVEIESGIKNFTVLSVPTDLYMDASDEYYSRNIVFPTTFEVVRHKLPISLLWIFSLYLVSQQLYLGCRTQEKTET